MKQYEFCELAKSNLKNSFELVTDAKGGPGKRKPDLVAVNGTTLTIIECKSDAESDYGASLALTKNPKVVPRFWRNIPAMGDYIDWAGNYEEKKKVAYWMVIIGVQLWYYAQNLTLGRWQPKEDCTGLSNWQPKKEINERTIEKVVPALVFHSKEKKNVEKALRRLDISDHRLRDLPNGQSLLEIDRNELLSAHGNNKDG